MPFAWADYLILAITLAANTADEASLRSSISRAYYAAYHAAVDKAGTHGVTIVRTAGTGVHEACWLAYQTVPRVVSIGVTGDRLKVRRHKADYQQINLNWAKEAATAVAEAQLLLSQL
jgi:uncharacterized protein (UPF0332 family)